MSFTLPSQIKSNSKVKIWWKWVVLNSPEARAQLSFLLDTYTLSSKFRPLQFLTEKPSAERRGQVVCLQWLGYLRKSYLNSELTSDGAALEWAWLCTCNKPVGVKIYLWRGNIFSASWTRIEQGSLWNFCIGRWGNSWGLTAPFLDLEEHICSDKSQPCPLREDEDGLGAKNLVIIQH